MNIFFRKYNLIDYVFTSSWQRVTEVVKEIYPQLGNSSSHFRTAWKRRKDNLKKKKDQKELRKLERTLKYSCSMIWPRPDTLSASFRLSNFSCFLTDFLIIRVGTKPWLGTFFSCSYIIECAFIYYFLFFYFLRDLTKLVLSYYYDSLREMALNKSSNVELPSVDETVKLSKHIVSLPYNIIYIQ